MARRLFIADDDRELVHSLAGRCRQAGFIVDEATDGMKAALGLFFYEHPDEIPDVVVLDLQMPSLDGFRLIEDLRRDSALEDVPTIIMTARDDRSTIRRCQDLGAYYLHKSTELWEHLQAVLDEILDQTATDDASPGAEAEPAAAETAR